MATDDLLTIENTMGSLIWAPSKQIAEILFHRMTSSERRKENLTYEESEENLRALQAMVRDDVSVGMFLASQLCCLVQHSEEVAEEDLLYFMETRSLLIERFMCSLLRISKVVGIQERRMRCRNSHRHSRTLHY